MKSLSVLAFLFAVALCAFSAQAQDQEAARVAAVGEVRMLRVSICDTEETAIKVLELWSSQGTEKAHALFEEKDECLATGLFFKVGRVALELLVPDSRYGPGLGKVVEITDAGDSSSKMYWITTWDIKTPALIVPRGGYES